MKEAGLYPTQKELNAVVAAAAQACDELVGVKDGVITETSKCHFDPKSAVGEVEFGGSKVTITPQIASIVKKIWEGPDIDSQQLWYGAPIGAPLDSLSNTTVSDGKRVGYPFFVPDTWVRYFPEQDPTYQGSNIGSHELKNLFLDYQTKYDDLFNNANPDLSRLRHLGGKLLVWHGEADQLIYPQGSTQYRQHVEAAMGGGAKVDNFYRYFRVPGVDHCAGGSTPGAGPTNALEALIAWVEKKRLPQS